MKPRQLVSDIVAVTALVAACGGVSYAAGGLPPHSVGTEQLREQSVTATRLATASVGIRALTPDLRDTVRRAAATPASRVSWHASAADGDGYSVVYSGRELSLRATCTSDGQGATSLAFEFRSDTGGDVIDHFTVAPDADPVQNGIIRFRLEPNTPERPSLPPVTSGHAIQVDADVIITTPVSTYTLDLAPYVDGTAGTCELVGTVLRAV